MNSAAWRARAKCDALAERHEGVVGAGHGDAVFAGAFDLVAQHQREFEDDGLLHLPARGPGAVVDAAMAGIDHHQRSRIAAGLALRGRLRRTDLRRAVLERDGAHERLAVGRGELEHEAGRLIVGGIDHEGLVDARGARQIDDDARAALHDEAEAECLDQAATHLPRLGRKLERDLRHVDHHPVRIGEREGVDVDLAVQIDDQARLRVIAAQPRLARHRKIIWPAARRSGRAAGLGRAKTAENRRGEEKEQARRAHRHGSYSPSEPVIYSITEPRLTQT